MRQYHRHMFKCQVEAGSANQQSQGSAGEENEKIISSQNFIYLSQV